MNDDHDLVSRCLKRDVAAEYELYQRLAPKMFGICLRYGGNTKEAEEILQIGFIKVFGKLHQFRFECSLEGWVHPIFVNTAINYCKDQLKFHQHVELKNVMEDATLQEDALSIMSAKELLSVIQQLPVGYRTIFNLYVIEAHRHDEIAQMLGISEGTSKSQLFRARAYVRNILKKLER